MSQSNKKNHHSGNSLFSRHEATAALKRHQKTIDCTPQMYWAQVDTLCQTATPVHRSRRKASLEQGWKQWIGNTPPYGLLRYYNEWMYAFYLDKVPRNPQLLFIQAGSLFAKLAWPEAAYASLNTVQMRDHCMARLEQLPGYECLTPKQKAYCRIDLLEILERYTTADGICEEQVRTFFSDNYPRYIQALDSLVEKLHKFSSKDQTGSENTDETDAPEAPEETEAPETEAEAEEAAPPEPVFTMADPDMPGLCSFIEKTSSAVYQRALSRLYALSQTPSQAIYGKTVQLVLGDYFSALRALEIEPIDEERLKAEFPEEYSLELRRRSADPSGDYTMVACGWSCNGYLITAPTFYKKKTEGGR